MSVLAGTAKGIFRLSEGAASLVLEGRHARDLVDIDGRLHASLGDGHAFSDDGGASWQRSDLQGPEVWLIRSGGGDVLYAGTQPAALYRSTDRGETWREVESFAAVPEAADWGIPLDPPIPARSRAMIVDAADPDVLHVGVEVGGIMTSRDSGQSWRMSLPGENPDLHMMFQHPTEPKTLFASTGYGRRDGIAEMIEGNAGVFRSDDGGESWTYAWAGITPRYSRPMCIDTRAPYGLTVASAPTAFSHHTEEGGAQAMLFRSEDGGRHWRSLCDDAHSPSAANFHGLNVDPLQPGGVLVGTDTGEVWQVSNDAAWQRLAEGLPLVWSVLRLH